MKTLMKSVTAGALVSLAAVVGSGSAKAGLCGAPTLNTLADFVTITGASNGVSCTVGDKTLGNFTFQPDGTNVAASGVGVGPDDLFAPLPGLLFNAFFSNSGTTKIDAFISFDV